MAPDEIRIPHATSVYIRPDLPREYLIVTTDLPEHPLGSDDKNAHAKQELLRAMVKAVADRKLDDGKVIGQGGRAWSVSFGSYTVP